MIPLSAVGAVFDGPLWHAFWHAVASTASVVALWADSKARRVQRDPVDELIDRLRHPIRWTLRHPVVSVRRKIDRRRA